MWMKIDDRMHAHRKTRALTRSHPDKDRDAAPMGLWVLAGSWASQNASDGWVPESELDRWDDDWQALAKRLVHSGYWWPEMHESEPGFGFNDWQEWNSPAASESGVFGNHVHWHVKKGVVKPDCEHCPTEPDEEAIEPEASPPNRPRSSPPNRPRSSPPNRDGIGSSIAPNRLPDPIPTRPDPDQTSVSSAIDIADPATEIAVIERQDVEQVCDHLAGCIEANGSKRPAITAKWRTAARLMLDKDGRGIEEIHGAIDWCQRDEFWRANILSLPTLREKFDTLRLQAQRQPKGLASRADEWKSMQERQMARAIEREREMGIR